MNEPTHQIAIPKPCSPSSQERFLSLRDTSRHRQLVVFSSSIWSAALGCLAFAPTVQVAAGRGTALGSALCVAGNGL